MRNLLKEHDVYDTTVMLGVLCVYTSSGEDLLHIFLQTTCGGYSE